MFYWPLGRTTRWQPGDQVLDRDLAGRASPGSSPMPSRSPGCVAPPVRVEVLAVLDAVEVW